MAQGSCEVGVDALSGPGRAPHEAQAICHEPLTIKLINRLIDQLLD